MFLIRVPIHEELSKECERGEAKHGSSKILSNFQMVPFYIRCQSDRSFDFFVALFCRFANNNTETNQRLPKQKTAVRKVPILSHQTSRHSDTFEGQCQSDQTAISQIEYDRNSFENSSWPTWVGEQHEGHQRYKDRKE